MPTEDFGTWRERITVVASGITCHLLSDAVPSGERWFLESVAVTARVTDNADCLVSIAVGGYAHVLCYLKNMTVGEWSSERRPCWLREGEMLYFEFTGIVAGERLDVHITGHKRFLTE